MSPQSARTESELALRGAPPGALCDRALDMLHIAPSQVGSCSKSARGCAPAAALAQPLLNLADRLLAKRHCQMLKRGKGFKRLAAAERHQLLIAVKTLRYTTEFFQGLYPAKRSKYYLAALRDLQDGGGHLNDVVVAEHLLADLTANALSGSGACQLERAAGKVIGWYDRALLSHEPAMRRNWNSFAARKPFWSRTGS